ncbi:MAG: hypothetical protein ACK4FY_06825 [Aquificaceae bacterium]
MIDFFFSFLRVLVALGIVIVLILITLPYILPLLQRLKWSREEKGSDVKIKRIIPFGRNMYVIELEIKGKLFVVVISEGAVEVIYRDEVDNN